MYIVMSKLLIIIQLKIINEDDYEEPQNDYKVESFDLKTNEFKQFWVDAVEIDRELTPEEIKETKIKIEALKYNL